jgi:hypothetical protein
VRVVGVAVVLGTLFVQGIVDFRSTTEAFPTVSMPSFEGAPDASGHRTITKLTIDVDYADGSRSTPTAEELFADFHYSSARFSIDYLLKNNSELDEETVDWLREQAARVGDGSAPTSLRFTWQQYDLDVNAVAGEPVGDPTITEVEL